MLFLIQAKYFFNSGKMLDFEFLFPIIISPVIQKNGVLRLEKLLSFTFVNKCLVLPYFLNAIHAINFSWLKAETKK